MPSPETDPSLLPVHILASEIAARRLSPVDLVEALLDRIKAKDGNCMPSSKFTEKRRSSPRGGQQGNLSCSLEEMNWAGGCYMSIARPPAEVQPVERKRRGIAFARNLERQHTASRTGC